MISETRGRQTVEITVYIAIDMEITNAFKTVEIIALEQRQEPNMTRHVRIVKFHIKTDMLGCRALEHGKS